MNLFMIMESFSATSINDDIGIVLILATPVLIVLAIVLFIAGVLNKEKKPKIMLRLKKYTLFSKKLIKKSSI